MIEVQKYRKCLQLIVFAVLESRFWNINTIIEESHEVLEYSYGNKNNIALGKSLS